jgi:fructoselysine-6-P-deglycase FrlB-like protein
MSYRCYDDIKTQASAWEAALAAVESRAEDLEKLFVGEPGELLFATCGSPYYLGLANATLWRERLGPRVTAGAARVKTLGPMENGHSPRSSRRIPWKNP